jgi:hypothetical protein
VLSEKLHYRFALKVVFSLYSRKEAQKAQEKLLSSAGFVLLVPFCGFVVCEACTI